MPPITQRGPGGAFFSYETKSSFGTRAKLGVLKTGTLILAVYKVLLKQSPLLRRLYAESLHTERFLRGPHWCPTCQDPKISGLDKLAAPRIPLVIMVQQSPFQLCPRQLSFPGIPRISGRCFVKMSVMGTPGMPPDGRMGHMSRMSASRG